jgi:hypothetical protein
VAQHLEDPASDPLRATQGRKDRQGESRTGQEVPRRGRAAHGRRGGGIHRDPVLTPEDQADPDHEQVGESSGREERPGSRSAEQAHGHAEDQLAEDEDAEQDQNFREAEPRHRGRSVPSPGEADPQTDDEHEEEAGPHDLQGDEPRERNALRRRLRRGRGRQQVPRRRQGDEAEREEDAARPESHAPPITCTRTVRVLGPSNSQKKTPCQVPSASLPPLTGIQAEEPIRLVFTWASELPSPWV